MQGSDESSAVLNRLGLPARSAVEEDYAGQVPNHRRRSNPFVTDMEPDWILIRPSGPQDRAPNDPASANPSHDCMGQNYDASDVHAGEESKSRSDSSNAESTSLSTEMSEPCRVKSNATPRVPRKPPALIAGGLGTASSHTGARRSD